MIWSFFTAAVLCILVSPLFPRHAWLTGFNNLFQPGLIYVACSYLCFLFPYVTLRLSERRSRVETRKLTGAFRPNVSTGYLLAVTIWSVIGASIGWMQIQTTLGFGRYLNALSEGGEKAEFARGATIRVDSAEGGLPGYVKVLNQNCTAGVLLLIFWLAEGRRFQGITRQSLAVLIVLSFVVRNFLYLDRLALLAVLPALCLLWINGSSQIRRYLTIMFVLIVGLAEIQSRRRGVGLSSLSFFVLYVQSGLINLNLMIDSFSGTHTLGLGTIFAPIYYVAKSFGVKLGQDFGFFWIWNDAQNAFGYLYEDFGWYAPLVFLPFGLLAGFMDSPSGDHKAKSISRVRARAFLSYAGFSVMFVPAFQGPEFWVTLLTVVLAGRAEVKYSRVLFRLPESSRVNPNFSKRTVSKRMHDLDRPVAASYHSHLTVNGQSEHV